MSLIPPRKVETHAYMLLDVARYLACVSVFIGHFLLIFIVRLYGLDATYFNKHNLFIAAGYYFSHAIAVMVFFVLSGFLIGAKALSEIHATQRFDLKDYLKKRILRIIPPLYFAILLSVLGYAVVKALHLFGSDTYFLTNDLYAISTKAELTLAMVLKCLILVPGDTHLSMNMPLWSLSYEFYYYLLFAWVLAVFVNKNFKEVGCLSLYVIVVPVIFLVLNLSHYLPMFLEVLVLGLVWLLGVFIAYWYLWHKPRLNPYVNLVLMFLVFIFIYPAATQWGEIPVELVGGVFAGFLILYLVNFKFKQAPPKILWLLARGSFYTYTFYLIHFPILLFSFSCLGQRLLNFHWPEYWALALGLFLLTSVVSFYLAKVLENRRLFERVLGWKGGN